jgi:hypothetical protein
MGEADNAADLIAKLPERSLGLDKVSDLLVVNDSDAVPHEFLGRAALGRPNTAGLIGLTWGGAANDVAAALEEVRNAASIVPSFINAITDTPSVDLNVTGANLTANVKRSASAGNQLSENSDGLYVPAVSVGFSDSESIDFEITGVNSFRGEVQGPSAYIGAGVVQWSKAEIVSGQVKIKTGIIAKSYYDGDGSTAVLIPYKLKIVQFEEVTFPVVGFTAATPYAQVYFDALTETIAYQIGSLDATQNNNKYQLCIVTSSDLTNVTGINYNTAFVRRPQDMMRQMLNVVGNPKRGFGLSGRADLGFDVASGIFYLLGSNAGIGGFGDQSYIDVATAGAISKPFLLRATSGSINTTQFDTLDPSNFNPSGTTISAVPNNNWQNMRVFGTFENVNPQNGNGLLLVVQYGPATYNTADDARTALASESFIANATTEKLTLLGVVQIKQGATNTNSTGNAVFIASGVWGDLGGSGGGGLALSVVDTTTIDLTLDALTNTLQASVVDGSITSAKIADGSIVGDDIADGTITGSKIVSNTITSSKIQDGTITGTDIATGTITSTNIQDLTIVAGDIADATITGAKIANTTITGAKLVNDTITSTQIAANAVGASELADNAVDTAAIVANAVTNAKLATMASNTIKGNITGASAAPADVPIKGALDAGLAGELISTDASNGIVVGADGGLYVNGSVIDLFVYTEAQLKTALALSGTKTIYVAGSFSVSSTSTWTIGTGGKKYVYGVDINFSTTSARANLSGSQDVRFYCNITCTGANVQPFGNVSSAFTGVLYLRNVNLSSGSLVGIAEMRYEKTTSASAVSGGALQAYWDNTYVPVASDSTGIALSLETYNWLLTDTDFTGSSSSVSCMEITSNIAVESIANGAQIYVSSSAASMSFVVALYEVTSTSGSLVLSLLGFATITTAVVGYNKAAFSAPIEMDKDKRYFLGYKPTTLNGRVAARNLSTVLTGTQGSAASGNEMSLVKFTPTGTATPPASIPVQNYGDTLFPWINIY